MIRIAYITAFLFCQLFANNEIEYKISFEYWLNDDLRIFAVDNVITLEVEDDAVYLSSNNWFGETLLDEDIEYSNKLAIDHILKKGHKNISNVNLNTKNKTFINIDNQFKNEWIYYHLLNANFQPLCRTCNSKKSNKTI